MCKEAPSDASAAFETQFARFQKTYPKLLKLLTEAPEYDQTRRGFSQSLAENRPATTHETRADECQALTHLLQSMLDEPAGRNAFQEYQEILAK